jgi:hypothetical protein
MFLTLQVITVLLVAVAMSLALAHALELPGKMRLERTSYIAVQTIYYPGFTFGGLSEGLGMLATFVLLLMTPRSQPAFGWTIAGFVALVAMQAVYWIITHPVNKFWLKGTDLKGVGRGFFSLGKASEAGDWRRLRDRWEYSHVLRAALSLIALVSLIVAIAI